MTSNRLITSIEIPGGWAVRSVQVADQELQLLLPADPDAFVYELESHAHDAADRSDIYWAQLWSAATVTAELVARAAWVPGSRALELGCGIGLVGLVAARAGLRVTFSDYVPLAVELALHNAQRNGIAAASGMVLDWRHPPAEPFDVLLASDVLYYAGFHGDLLNTLEQMLASDGVCWIGDAGREPSLGFLELAKSQFKVELRDAGGEKIVAPQFGHYFMAVLRR